MKHYTHKNLDETVYALDIQLCAIEMRLSGLEKRMVELWEVQREARKYTSK